MQKHVTITIFSILCISTFLGTAGHAGGSIPPPKIEKINDQVYALIAPLGFPDKDNQGYMSNSTVIIGDKGVILVDTGFTDEIGQHIKKSIATFTDKPVTHVINTHHHGDHVLGNVVFKDAEIISAEKCRELMNAPGYAWVETVENMTGKKFPNTKIIPAKTVYPEKSTNTITLQGIPMELIVPAGSHTPGDIMVHLPQYKLLVSGDILVKTMMPSFIDAHVKTLINTIDDISKMDIQTVIPGHGQLMNMSEVKAMHKRIEMLYAGVEAGYKKGLTDSEIRKTLDLSEWKNFTEFENLMGLDINRTFLEVEEANF
jgi:glyoxylase-like metal-dependent hydrolase (beta-lactamase superfamily II)